MNGPENTQPNSIKIQLTTPNFSGNFELTHTDMTFEPNVAFINKFVIISFEIGLIIF